MLDERFDVILASEVIEHLLDPSPFVTVLRDHLAPPDGRRHRIWHARRNIEMLPGIFFIRFVVRSV